MKENRSFWNGPSYAVIQAMKARGNQPGVIAQWVALAHQWALDNRGPDSEAIRAWLPYFQPRPFYTCGELVPMWPALIVALGLTDRPPKPSEGKLRYELDFGGLPTIKNVDGTECFRHPVSGLNCRFYIVEHIHHWRKQPLTQGQFERAWKGTDR